MNHIFQLAAYCHLVEENYGGFVPYGVLVYEDRHQYKIPFDPKIRFELESTINEMRRSIKNR
jgi:CRISPR/Cas system-associated exonuclease Cas4 (RecB family)